MAPGVANTEKGFALVVVLWTGMLVAAIAGAFVVDTQISTRLARNFTDDSEARALADGGVYIAAFELLRSNTRDRWRRDGRVYRLDVPGGELRISIENEAGKIDLNSGSPLLIENLLTNAGMMRDAARRAAEAIDARRRPAASDRPRRLGAGEQRKAFVLIDEVSGFAGVSAALFGRVRAALTVHGNEGGLDLATAQPQALMAIPGMTAEVVEAFLMHRAAGDGAEAADRLVAIGQTRDFALDAADEGRFVTIRVLAKSGSGARFSRRAVVELTPRSAQGFEIREWREDPWTPDGEPAASGSREQGRDEG